jgi:hypothetical protein
MKRIQRFSAYLGGLGLGLYLARVLVEATRVAWSLPASLALVILTAAAGLGLAFLITRQTKTSTFKAVQDRPDPREPAPAQARHEALWAALPLWLYVFWPRQDPDLAWGVGLTTLVVWLMQGARSRWAEAGHRVFLLDASVFLVPLLIYLFTLAPGLQPADGGEFQLVTARFGVAHPPGYPLYSLLGGLVVRLPLGPDPAWRLNLFSAVTAAATLGLVSRVVRKLTGSATAGLLAVLTLGSATTFWATATSASIRPLTAFFAALALHSLTAPRFTFHVSRLTFHVSRPTAFAIALGLGFAHHASLAFLGAVGWVYLLLVDPTLLRQPRRCLGPIAALALTQLVWLYLPLRDAADAPLAPGNLTTLKGLADHILARGFAGDMFAFATSEHLADRVALLPTLLRFQFMSIVLVAAVIGALLLLRRDWRRFVLLAGAFALHTFVTLTYRAPQTVEYAMPAYVALAMLVGEVGGWVPRYRSVTSVKMLLNAVVMVAGLLSIVAAWPSFRYLAQQDDAREYAETLLQAAPERAIVLSNWHWATPMWYLQRVEGLRPDVKVKYVAPQGASLAQNYVDGITEHADERPVVVLRTFDPEYGGVPYRIEPLGPAFVVQTEPVYELELYQHLMPLDIDLGGQVRVLGFAVYSEGKRAKDGAILKPGRPLALDVAWTPLRPLEGEVAIFAHLLREGRLVGQGSDQRHAAASYQPGQIILDRFLVYPFEGVMPGEVQLSVGAYRPKTSGTPRLATANGADYVSLGTVHLRPADFPPVTSRPLRVPFSGGPTLVGVDWDTTVPGQWRLYLHWQGRSQPTTLNTVIRRGEEALVPAQVRLPGKGYVSSVYDLPQSTESLLLTADARAIGPWGGAVDRLSLPDPRAGERYVPIGGEMVLMNVAVDKPSSLLPGDPLNYDLRWVATRPLVRDRIISVSLVGLGPDGSWAWRDLSDGVPALGAIPTLKWIHGSTVLDRHRLSLPDDAPKGPAQARIQVYDHFTQAVLPSLDARLLPGGAGIPLHTWSVGEPLKE